MSRCHSHQRGLPVAGERHGHHGLGQQQEAQGHAPAAAATAGGGRGQVAPGGPARRARRRARPAAPARPSRTRPGWGRPAAAPRPATAPPQTAMAASRPTRSVRAVPQRRRPLVLARGQRREARRPAAARPAWPARSPGWGRPAGRPGVASACSARKPPPARKAREMSIRRASPRRLAASPVASASDAPASAPATTSQKCAGWSSHRTSSPGLASSSAKPASGNRAMASRPSRRAWVTRAIVKLARGTG